MPFQAWIPPRSDNRCRPQPARFNGAMPFQAWIRPWIVWVVDVMWVLQWGHALSGMDTAPDGEQKEGLGYASMGPCPFRHGYFRLRSASVFACTASMGPCPFRHGYTASHDRREPDRRSFNGAMPFQAWIRGYATHADAMQAVASMGPCPFRHGYVRRLQDHALILVDASMGPCPFRHGYLPHGRRNSRG